MALTLEWRGRIEAWKKALAGQFYRKIQDVQLEGFVTDEQLSRQEAEKRRFKPMQPGTRWGPKWAYGWFAAEVAVPDAAAGRRVHLQLNPGGQGMLTFVNGKAVGAIDGSGTGVALTRSAAAGEEFRILAEAYAGHGPRVTTAGPVPDGVQTVPEPGPAQAEVGSSSLGLWQEDVYQLWLDLETLWQIRQSLDGNCLRVAQIDRALRDFTVIVDPELEGEQFLATVARGRERLRPLLEKHNGPTAPTMYCFGHGHLDVAWLWPLAETERKIARTLANQLSLIEEYGQYKFHQGQPHLYRMLRRRYPELYERAKKAVADGSIIADGAMWVEADTNISAGEALIRQFVHGIRFFREELGVEPQTLWLPDVFGYSGALPQIMRGCGIRFFSTHKIFWTYHGGEVFPYHNFFWQGIDGTDVLVHLHNDYNARTDPASVIRRWDDRVQKDGMSMRLFPFGHGDGGRGPTRDHMEFVRRLGDCEGVPKMKIATPAEFFHDLEEREKPNHRYVGELYYQGHRGTYTSQAGTKKGNRRSELALREAEMWAAAATAINGFDWPADDMDRAWKKVLLNQFHDVLPGSSIARVYEQAEAAYDEAINEANKVAAAAASTFTTGDAGVTVFNSLNWRRNALVAVGEDAPGAVTQEIDGVKFAEVTVPPCGWATVTGPEDAPSPAGREVTATESLLENSLLRVEFDGRGQITSIYDKQAHRELAAGLCNRMKMYRDVPSAWDAWDIDSMYELTPVELGEPAEIEVVAAGALVGCLRLKRRINNSTMIQTISLRHGSRRVDFETNIDWRESHKMLKVAFEVDYHADEAIHEIQFGHIRRPNHKSRPFDADRFEVCNHKWSALAEENRGFAVLNDCKYGLNVLAKSISLTLLRAPKAPDMNADVGEQEFTYSFYAWNGPLCESSVVHEAYELNCPVMVIGGLAGRRSLLGTDAPNVIVEAVKPAEDLSGDVVVRLYESLRMTSRCKLSVDLPVTKAAATNMLEDEVLQELPCDGGTIALDFRPFEIKTIRLSRR